MECRMSRESNCYAYRRFLVDVDAVTTPRVDLLVVALAGARLRFGCCGAVEGGVSSVRSITPVRLLDRVAGAILVIVFELCLRQSRNSRLRVRLSHSEVNAKGYGLA